MKGGAFQMNRKIMVAKELVKLARMLVEKRDRKAYYHLTGLHSYDDVGMTHVDNKVELANQIGNDAAEMLASKGVFPMCVFEKDGEPVAVMSIGSRMFKTVNGESVSDSAVKKCAARWVYSECGCDDDKFRGMCMLDFVCFKKYLNDSVLKDMKSSSDSDDEWI